VVGVTEAAPLARLPAAQMALFLAGPNSSLTTPSSSPNGTGTMMAGDGIIPLPPTAVSPGTLQPFACTPPRPLYGRRTAAAGSAISLLSLDSSYL